jgi:hypothetical protein
MWTSLIKSYPPLIKPKPPIYGKCLCGGQLESYEGPPHLAPNDLIYRGFTDWQCPKCFGWFEEIKMQVECDNEDVESWLED